MCLPALLTLNIADAPTHNWGTLVSIYELLRYATYHHIQLLAALRCSQILSRYTPTPTLKNSTKHKVTYNVLIAHKLEVVGPHRSLRV